MHSGKLGFHNPSLGKYNLINKFTAKTRNKIAVTKILSISCVFSTKQHSIHDATVAL